MLTHAFGERYDSPVPLALFVVGGAAVVLVSFALISRRGVDVPADLAVRTDRPADVTTHPAGRAASIGSVAVLALLVLTGLLGSQQVAENLLPVTFWLVVWVVGPLLVGVFGDFTAPLNPFAAIARAADREGLRRIVLGGPALPWPPRLGYWLFAALYTIVVFGELVVNTTATLPRVTAVALISYAIVCAAGGLVFGAVAWNSHAELFTVLFASWGRLGYHRFAAAGRRGLGGGLGVPFDNAPGRLVGVLLLLVSVSFDGLLSTPHWTRWLARLPAGVQPGTGGYLLLATAVLAGLTGAMLLVFGAFALAAARAGGHAGPEFPLAGPEFPLARPEFPLARPEFPLAGPEFPLAGPEFPLSGLQFPLTGLLPSLLPIAYGYLLAHYLQYVLVNGQLLLPLLGNPVGLAGWPIHLPYPFDDSFTPNPGIMPTSVVWYVQIVVIIAAHVLAVVLAHRQLTLRARDLARARRSEWPWLMAMVGYTMLSLWLLAQPLVAESGSH